MNDRTKLFESEPIGRAVAKLAVPTVLSSLVMVLYNLADTYFVGMLNDPIQNAGVALAAPVLLAFNAINNLFGVGSSSMMSRALGRRDYETVYRSSAFGFYCALFCGIAFSLLCVVFQRPLETETFHNFWVALLAALVIHGINILVSELVIRDRDPMRKSFFRFSAIFSNCGFMAVPLQTAILGSLGVFYGSAYLLVFTVLTWTLGIQLVKGGKMAFSWRTLLMNPGVTLAVVIAASTPPAALLGMFAAKFDRDVSLAPSLVAVQTLLSMITMPLVLGLAKFLV